MKKQRPAGQMALIAALGLMTQLPAVTHAAEQSFNIYGFAQLDYIQDFGRVNPDWVDTLRPSKIPVVNPEEFGSDGESSVSIKQSRLGLTSNLPTAKGDIFVRFEFDLFGVGADAGQTTLRIRQFYGEYGQFLAGQINSLFMDGDIFPNTIDYWGPNGMVFLRNPQIRWTPLKGSSNFAIAIEKPSDDIDEGQFRQVANLGNLVGKTEYPDLTAQFRQNGDFGHVQLAGILRSIGAEVVTNDVVTYEDSTLGWGLNLTGAINVFARDSIRAGVVYGKGIASYMNDGGMDAGQSNALVNGEPPGGTQIEAVPLLGISAYYDHYWNDRFSSAIGYSSNQVDNTPGQQGVPGTFKKGQYASLNLLYYPVNNIMTGVEALWGELEDVTGNTNDDTRVQFSVRYSFNSGNLLARKQ